MLSGGQDPEVVLRRALKAFDEGRPLEGFTWLLHAAEAEAEDEEWVARIAAEWYRRDPFQVWEVWQIRCQRPDAGVRDFEALARAYAHDAYSHAPGPPPIIPTGSMWLDHARGLYRAAVEAFRKAISKASDPERMAQLYEEEASLHAHFGRFMEAQMALECVAELRPPRNRWRGPAEPEDSADLELP